MPFCETRTPRSQPMQPALGETGCRFVLPTGGGRSVSVVGVPGGLLGRELRLSHLNAGAARLRGHQRSICIPDQNRHLHSGDSGLPAWPRTERHRLRSHPVRRAIEADETGESIIDSTVSLLLYVLGCMIGQGYSFLSPDPIPSYYPGVFHRGKHYARFGP